MKGIIALIGSAVLAATAANAGSPPDFYTLRKDSSYESGCYDPCDCVLVLHGPVRGGFRLVHTGYDGLFDHYQVDPVRWRVLEASREIPVSGSGTYRIGGEVALLHQLTLDLQVGDEPVRRFDSGLIAPSTPFPHIDARVSVNGEVCFDQVFEIHARRTRGLDVGRSTLWWEAEPPADSHDVVHGSLLGLRTAGLQGSIRGCLARATSAGWLDFAPDPPAGEGYWFLLRDMEGSMAGSWDTGSPDQAGSRDEALAQTPAACP